MRTVCENLLSMSNPCDDENTTERHGNMTPPTAPETRLVKAIMLIIRAYQYKILFFRILLYRPTAHAALAHLFSNSNNESTVSRSVVCQVMNSFNPSSSLATVVSIEAIGPLGGLAVLNGTNLSFNSGRVLRRYSTAFM